jgi:hypothetical protein
MQQQSRTPFGVISTECPACLGLPECTAGCDTCGGTGEVEAQPAPVNHGPALVSAPEGRCPYCEADPCECAAVDLEIEWRLEQAHYDDLGWDE